MDDEVMRLECLKLAQGDTVMAKDLFEFIKSRGKYSTGALKGYAPPDEPAQKARVVGRDGKLEKPFDDYLREDK